MRRGGNSKFKENVGNVNLKFYSQQAILYRFEVLIALIQLALGLSQHDSELSTNNVSPNKSFISLED